MSKWIVSREGVSYELSAAQAQNRLRWLQVLGYDLRDVVLCDSYAEATDEYVRRFMLIILVVL